MHVSGAGPDDDSDAWNIDLLMIGEESMRRAQSKLLDKRRASYKAWRRKWDIGVVILSAVCVAYTAGVVMPTAWAGKTPSPLMDLLIAFAVGLGLTLATAASVRIVAAAAHKLHLNLDLELLQYHRIHAARIDRIHRDVRGDIAELRALGEALRRQNETLLQKSQDQTDALQKAVVTFLAEGDRDAEQILRESERIIAGNSGPGPAGLRPVRRIH
ncbi:hypothetical protein [Micromonospora sp. NPDC005173]|uniref:hypothetical protein n=1 Tax=Micromonospora sp. NPDC005173 TaxID=3157165 RepID=UPI0033AE5581